MDDDQEEGIWEIPGRSFEMNMEQVFESQMRGMMELARMMGAASGMAMDPFQEEEYQMRHNPYYNDAGPIPTQEQHTLDPTFVAPHS